MKYLVLAAVVLFAASAFGQSSAKAEYASNGKMIAISDIVGLQECSVTNLSGKVIKVKNGGEAIVGLKTDSEKTEFRVSLANINAEDKAVLFKHLITKGNTLQIGGYKCSDGEMTSAFSIRRVY